MRESAEWGQCYETFPGSSTSCDGRNSPVSCVSPAERASLYIDYTL